MPGSIRRLIDYAGASANLGRNPLGAATIFWKQTKNIRVRLGLAKHHPEEVYRLETVYGPLYFRDNFGDITNIVDLLYRSVYRLGAVREPGVILDVGANIGLAAAWFAFHNAGRPIYCFEPLPDNAAMIRRNCPSAVVTEAAVGAEAATVNLNVDPDSVMASRIDCAWDTNTREFEVMTLDAFAESRVIDRIAILKIDAEGMEVDILAGAGSVLSRTSYVTMETHGGDRHESVLATLKGSGFTIHNSEFGTGTGMILAGR